jgi:hypothetical protein
MCFFVCRRNRHYKWLVLMIMCSHNCFCNVQKMSFNNKSINKFCLNVTIISEKECVAIIFYFYAYDMDQHFTHSSNLDFHRKNICPMKARIQKNGKVMYKCHLFVLRHDDPTDNVYFCTLWRHHNLLSCYNLMMKLVYMHNSLM